jgi:peptidyl-tRNA hydrolase
MSTEKLYVVVRRDLSPGQQLSQAIHAADAFAVAHPQTKHDWMKQSNTLAVLSVDNEAQLEWLERRAFEKNVNFASFREPDLNHSLTAVVLEPNGKCLCRKLRLAG